MIIGVMTLEFHLPSSRSLKSKRFILKSLKERLFTKFNVSVAEIEYHDLWQRTRLAVVVVSRDRRFANSVLSKVTDLAQREREAVLTHTETYFV
ncbi:MAG: hypothetical protein A2Z06_02755 [Candidatus Glassbacteria bacterium RBG_16_58_8]|uniref:Cytoplasmic protein n=1 Tax=Candidatus Glassbacteria bacterium RBG_16_58_8 TaxID=1817866 RepID=A0A1F5YD46_9BACT|nr:MAG: hypothetical protein A2Z06_02755 [Candidatus Glassbacteria bacterium RBG_16_58_8]